MTLNEKLDNFYASVIDSAASESIKITDEYKTTLQKIYDEHKQAAVKKANNTYRIESENIIREKNCKLSKHTLDLKRDVLIKTAEFSDKIFHDVESKLNDFIKTPSYKDYLVKMINKAKEIARDEKITIYINPSDEALKTYLEEKTGTALFISDRDFFGGIRALIPSRTMLIDHSFVTKLTEAKNSFKL